MLGGVGLLAIAWTCRGVPLGTPVADDHSFLYRLAFQHPLDPFDSMGAAYYWRPLSRQGYFSLVGGGLLSVPGLGAVVNALLLVTLFAILYRIARPRFGRIVAAAIALVPLLAEPARVLLTWPSGVQHLLASLFAALALHEALAGRVATAGGAALAGVLSHESAFLVIPALPVVAWMRTQRLAETLRGGAASLAVIVLWVVGYRIAIAHGVQLPTSPGDRPWTAAPQLFRLAVAASLNLEDLRGTAASLLSWGYGALLLVAVANLGARATRVRLKKEAGVLLLAGAGFVLGLAPLGFLLPDWNSWRAWVPFLPLGGAVTVFFGLVSPWLAATLVALRLVALLLAAPAAAVVTTKPPPSTSDLSFVRIARLQRTLASAQHELLTRHPALPRDAEISYWNLPRMMRIGFADSLAIRVWYRDSTLNWKPFGRLSGLSRPIEVLLQFTDNRPSPASVVEIEAVKLFQQGGRAILAGQGAEAESLLALASQRHSLKDGPFAGWVAMNRGIAAYSRGDFPRAERLAAESRRLSGESADYWALIAHLAYVRGDRQGAQQALQRCFSWDPRHSDALRLAAVLQRPP